MEQVTATSKSSQANQGVSPTEGQPSTPTETAPSDFDVLLKRLLVPDRENNVSEEELFAALTVERVKSTKGQEAADRYETILKKLEAAMTKSNGYIPYENAARKALKEFQAQGELTEEEANKIHSEAFGAAQLDNNLDALYDNIGGVGDLTKAVMSLKEAMTNANSVIAKYMAGTVQPTSRPLSEGFSPTGKVLTNPYMGSAPTNGGAVPNTIGQPTDATTPHGTNVDGPDGFLFKPISSNNGKLAILMPALISRDVESVVLKDSNGRELESGYFWAPGFGAEGEVNPRKKFSFQRPGSSYPKNLTVEARLGDGTTMTWQIPNPAKRYD